MINTKQSKLCILLLLGTLCLLGCGKSDQVQPQSQESQSLSAVGKENAPSDVKLTIPKVDSGPTLVLRAEGNFDPAAHDFAKPFEFEFKGRMHYRMNIFCKPYVKDDWAINPIADVTNSTESKLNVAYYAAFFNQQGELIGCCHHATDIKPSERPISLSAGFEGPKERMLTATNYKLVVYESTQRIGVLPISAEQAATLVGRSSKVVTHLDAGQPVISSEGENKVVRFQAKVKFADQVDKARDTYLKFDSVEPYQFSINVRKRDATITTTTKEAGKVVEQYTGWEMESDFERLKPAKSVWPKAHVVLLNAQGQLIACDREILMYVSVPEDALLSATQLEFVLYEDKIERK